MVIMPRIEEMLSEKKWSRRELERRAGISVGALNKWNTVSPTTSKLQKVADVLQVSVAYLTGESDYKSEQDAIIAKWVSQQAKGLADEVRRIEAGVRIPVLGSVACGIPIDAIEMLDVEDWEEIPERLARTGKFFGLIAKGDSMFPRIQEGDIMIVRQQETCESGDVVIVEIHNNEACCKKLLKQTHGIVLHSFNPDFEPIFIDYEEVNKNVRIIGKVVENRQKF